MPLRETEWDVVTEWLASYLLDTVEPHSALLAYGFPQDFLGGLRLGQVSRDNARALVHASRRDIGGQVRLLEVVTALDRLAVRPEIGTAREFLARLRADAAAHGGDVFRSCVLQGGCAAFIDREDLRETLRRFVADPEKSVLLVDGEPDSGRSYTYVFLRHLGQHRGFRPARVTLSRTSTARQVLERLAAFLDAPGAGQEPFDPTGLNDPLPSLELAVHRMVARATTADERYWLVLDECDRLDPHSDVWDLIGLLALAVYEHAALRGDRAPRLVLLGYGRAMRPLPYDVRTSQCWDIARVAEPDDLRRFFRQVFREAPPAAAGAQETDELAEVAVDEVLHAVRSRDGNGESYMRRLCAAAEGAIRVYRSL
ncbi:hypothetical protein ADL22_06520 [Streptomyces sp. NRRL F-4489]|uniref:ATP-binding protein n=1 Tax=Streptomyces sp. NRRL F-4489 TaxID=1609095 RepID=UPI0007496AA7|nr:ATP-binding protein [Streptomyces sp. NRRL F-4489]KUL51441.1 hypothetical protein ADL22_06520 [Streptomyces sp. NRRL F-4489]